MAPTSEARTISVIPDTEGYKGDDQLRGIAEGCVEQSADRIPGARSDLLGRLSIRLATGIIEKAAQRKMMTGLSGMRMFHKQGDRNKCQKPVQ